MMMLGFMAILCICQSGCFYWTRKMWHERPVREQLHRRSRESRYSREARNGMSQSSPVRSVRVSPHGDLCVIYTVKCIQEGRTRHHLFRPPYDGYIKSYEASRAIILTRSDLRNLTRKARDLLIPVIDANTLQQHVLPSDVLKRTFDQDHVQAHTAMWREIPIVLFTSRAGSRQEYEARWKKRRVEARAAGAAFFRNYPEQSPWFRAASFGNDPGQSPWNAFEVPDGDGGRVILMLPERHASNPLVWPLRLLLTPPAVALDLVEVAISPVAVPIAVYLELSDFDSIH
jgi:hypothetical protein